MSERKKLGRSKFPTLYVEIPWGYPSSQSTQGLPLGAPLQPIHAGSTLGGAPPANHAGSMTEQECKTTWGLPTKPGQSPQPPGNPLGKISQTSHIHWLNNTYDVRNLVAWKRRLCQPHPTHYCLWFVCLQDLAGPRSAGLAGLQQSRGTHP